MKSNKKGLWLIAIIAIVGFIGIACDPDKDTGNNQGNNQGNNLQYKLGDTGPGGGKIFYINSSGFTVQGHAGSFDSYTAHFLEAASDDMPTMLEWQLDSTSIEGTGDDIGTGRRNTKLIVDHASETPAASACDDYRGGGKDDWFLPSRYELNQLYINRTHVGNLTNNNYWSSSQQTTANLITGRHHAWYQDFLYGLYYNHHDKDSQYSVRPVRAF